MSTRYRFLFAIISLLGIALLGLPGCGGGSGDGGGSGGGGSGGGEAGTPEFVSLGTAQIGGAFYSVGAAISDALNEGKEMGGWRKATAEATGGFLGLVNRISRDEQRVLDELGLTSLPRQLRRVRLRQFRLSPSPTRAWLLLRALLLGR